MENIKVKLKDELLPIEDIKSYILSQYDLSDSSVTTVKFKDTDKQRAVYRIDKNNTSYCLKKVYYDEENLLYVYSAMEWVYRNGVNVPKLLPTVNNHRYTKYNDMLFILTPWVNGEKCDFDNLDNVLLSSRTLGKLHKISKNFTPINGSCLREGFDDYNTSVNKHFNQLLTNISKAHMYNDRFSKIFLDNLDENLELAKLSLEISSSINTNELSCSLCHGDYVNKNIIICGDNISLIDFDKCKTDYSAHDIAYFLRRLLKREKTNWQVNLTLKVLDSYMEYNTLTSSDLKYILAYIAFPQKYWKLSRDYYKNIRRCNKNSFILLLEKGLERTGNQLEFIYELIKVFESKYNVTF
ncbi:CotS family spore coat protein [Clostridium carnis]